MKESKRNWFQTLNEALASEELVGLWPLGENVNYGETCRVFVQDGSKMRMISVYRSECGIYERPVHYMTQMAA